MPMTPKSKPIAEDWVPANSRRKPTDIEHRVALLFNTGLHTTRIAEHMTRELGRPFYEHEAYNALGMVQFFKYMGVLNVPAN